MLRRETHGVLKIVDGQLKVVSEGPNKKKTKTYDAKPRYLRPAMAVTDQLDGLEATVVWDVAEGSIVEINVMLPEGSGPIPLPKGDHFLNPYAFVSLPDERPTGLGDDVEPAGHDRYDQDRWTGTVEITITTRTPLLLPDHARAAAAGGDGLPVRLDHQGRPLLAGSAVKGALRSAYEAITNSRLGVFEDHDLPLAIRSRADETVAKLRPAWVSSADSNRITLKVVTALEPTGNSIPRSRRTCCWRCGCPGTSLAVTVAASRDAASGMAGTVRSRAVSRSRRGSTWRHSARRHCGESPPTPNRVGCLTVAQ